MTLHQLLMSEQGSLIEEYFELWLTDPTKCPPEVDVLLKQAAVEELRAQLPRVQFIIDFRKRLERIIIH